MALAKNLQQTVVKLNVGGVRFETSLSTLTRYPESMFATWFAYWNPESQEEYFIDFDGASFKLILEFLRYGESIALPKDEASLERIAQAADYFQLFRLQALVQASLQCVDRRGLSGKPINKFDIVMLSDYGIAACVESLVAQSFGHAQPPVTIPKGYVLPLVLGPVCPRSSDGISVCCAACLQTQYVKLDCLESQLNDALRKSREVFVNQLQMVQFKVTEIPIGCDCVIVMAIQSFNGNKYHVSKSFLRGVL